jgi:cell division protein FtsB
MSANRRRNANLLPVAKILLIGLLLLTVGGGALFYVNAKNEVHRNGQRKKELERELLALETKDEVVVARIAKLSSFDALRKRQSQDREVFAKLVPVADNQVVKLQDITPAAGESQVRAVSNFHPAR